MKNDIISVQGTIIDLNKVFLITEIDHDLAATWFTIRFYGPGDNKLTIYGHLDYRGMDEYEAAHQKTLKEMETFRDKIIERWCQFNSPIENFEL